MRPTVVPALALLTAACEPPPEAPASIQAAAEHLFLNFEADDDDLAFYVEDLEAKLTAEGVDLTGDKAEREFVLPPLQHHLLDVPVPDGIDADDQTPVLLFGMSRHGFDANLDVALEPNQVCIESKSTVSYARTYTSDRACFEAGTCDALRSTNEVRKEIRLGDGGGLMIASGWYDIFKDFRRLELADGRPVLVSRSWTEEVFIGDNGRSSFAQTYTSELWIGEGDQTARMYGIWTEIDIGLPADTMKKVISDTIEELFERGDAFAEGGLEYCKQDRDAVFERPDAG